MDFWTPEQIAKFIPIKDAFEEFCEADPELSKLDSTKPDPTCEPKEFDKWYAGYCPPRDAAVRRFAGLFREEVLTGMGLEPADDKEREIPPEYWAITEDDSTDSEVEHAPDEGEGFASLLVMKEMVQDRRYGNYYAVLKRENWEEWKAKQEISKYESPQRNRKTDVVADRMREIRIKKVLAITRRRWPDPKRRPEIDLMARELERLDREPKLPHSEQHGYKFETIRKILRGTYKTSVRFDIAGL